MRLDMLAQTVVLTSQGLPFLWNGEELMRDKKGVHNSYCSPDSINAIDWNLKARNQRLCDYYAGLIALRKAHPAFRLGDAELVRQHLEFIDTPECTVAFRLKDNAGGDAWKDIVVIANAKREAVKVELPDEEPYIAVVANGVVNAEGLFRCEKTAVVAPQSAMILHK